ncbi:MAG TPA: Ku protein [Firmicutes bacterium]|jgi:DNA end-binding protein Ku|nr:Ku protein [Bacillota bacterium]
MRTLWKGAISFGLVNIPVKMYTATERKDLHFHQLHATCKTPIQYRKFCPSCQVEVNPEELVRGYEYEKGKYVILREEDLQMLPGENTKTIDILDFVDLAEIDPVYFDRSYYLGPNPGGEKAYALLKQAMAETGKIAIARVMIRSKTVLACIRGWDQILVMETMFFPDEIRAPERLTAEFKEVTLHPNEISMATSLIGNLSSSFEPGKYTNEYRSKLMEMIQAKIAGEEVAIPTAPETGKVVDLMEALRASLQATTKQEEEPPKKRRKKKTG